jgi:V8-like Glu-specific endopeptidase
MLNLINDNWVLTAAHCLEENPISGQKLLDIRVILGEDDTSRHEGKEVGIKAARVINF